jgi:elongation factor P--beta-lysine ligase
MNEKYIMKALLGWLEKLVYKLCSIYNNKEWNGRERNTFWCGLQRFCYWLSQVMQTVG